ncbi:HipA family kinase [Xylanibacter ruminicola]|uniref:HipA family kinase n=1 Tax=Xylanibacter ruminicola TaxID=839 RepID=UPI00048B6471|nr:HipA family kinase [Xylanibacter ruminicola]
MAIPILDSVKTIEYQYSTGETPVLVMCSDKNAYICKYVRSRESALKLVCELIGANMAKAWQLLTPDIAFVQIKNEHCNGKYVKNLTSSLSLGSKLLDRVVDVTPGTDTNINLSTTVLRQLLKIALFDFWIANEDRNMNNANLLYDVGHGKLVSIDYGCILNTASFDCSMSLLTSNESIICTSMFQELIKDKKISIESIIDEFKQEYKPCLNRGKKRIKIILEELPDSWNVPKDDVKTKMLQLFEERWTTIVWNCFVECIRNNVENG